MHDRSLRSRQSNRVAMLPRTDAAATLPRASVMPVAPSTRHKGYNAETTCSVPTTVCAQPGPIATRSERLFPFVR